MISCLLGGYYHYVNGKNLESINITRRNEFIMGFSIVFRSLWGKNPQDLAGRADDIKQALSIYELSVSAIASLGLLAISEATETSEITV